jgi:serine/threonine protein kinase
MVDLRDRDLFPDSPVIRSGSRKCFLARDKRKGAVSWVETFGEADLDSFFREQEIFVKLVHPALLGLIGLSLSTVSESATLVTEYMAHGSLKELIANPGQYASLSATAKAKIAVGLVLGLKYMHDSGLFHRNLNPSNILLDEKDEPHTAGYRFARMIDRMGMSMTGGLGTLHFYTAPEMFGPDNPDYGKEVDVFSFAMILWEIITGTPVVIGYWNGKDPGIIRHLKAVQDGRRPATVGMKPLAVRLLESSWGKDPARRMNFGELLNCFKEGKYEILPKVDPVEVARYVERIEEYEEVYPPVRARLPHENN